MPSDPETGDNAFAALTDCCRLWLETEPSGALADRALDWDRLGRLAFVHNLEPLLHHLGAEKLLARSDVPGALGERWEKAYFENFVFNSRALELLAEMADRCGARDLPIVSIKGPVVIGRAYRDPALRVMADLDLLCRESDLPAVVEIARGCGFTGGEETAVYHAALQHRELNLLLELHFDLYDFLPDSHRLHREMLDAARPISSGDVAIPAPPNDLERALEVAHLVNHDLRVNLKPLLDLALGRRVTPPSTDFPRVLERWDLFPEYHLITRLIDRLFATGGSSAAAETSARAAADCDAAAEMIANIEEWGPPEALLELAARKGLVAKIRYLLRLLLPPRERIIELTNHPADQGGGAPLPLAAHIAAVFRRGWRKLRGAGLARRAGTLSIKRRVYARRQRR